MTIIAGVTVNWRLNPRVITIPVAETSITVEDLQDTLLDLEDSEEGMIWPHLRETSGGEDLGGGTSVGLTTELQDAQVSFAQRTTSVESGTVTTANAAGTTLIDSTALFITNGVIPGASVINFADLSVATVLSVDSETQLTHYALEDGTDNDWDISDSYKIFNEIQCEVTGGNSVAVDGVGSPISAIFPTFGTQVLKTSSSSATTQELEDIQYSSFNGAIHIDMNAGVSGTAFPIGTPRRPVNNLADALLINIEREFDEFEIIGDFTLANGESLSGFKIRGKGVTYNVKKTAITLEAGCSTSQTEYHDCHITGDQGGESIYRDCLIEDLVDSHCSYHRCGFVGTITMPGGGGFDTHTKDVIDCHTGRTNFTWDMNAISMDFRFVRFSGDITFSNGTSATSTVELHMQGGTVTIDASCTASTFNISGDGTIINNSTATVNDNGTYTKLLELWQRLGLDPDNPLITNDDNSISVGSITIGAVNGATSTTQTRT